MSAAGSDVPQLATDFGGKERPAEGRERYMGMEYLREPHVGMECLREPQDEHTLVQAYSQND
eukprot:548793-Rhodomonas_salina.1